MFHHGRYLDRLLEVCPCGNSVLCNVCLPGSKHVTKVASLAVHLLPCGTCVEATSSRALLSDFPSYSSLRTRHASNPKRRGPTDTRERALPSHFVMSKGMNCFACRDTVRVQTIIRDERSLICSDASNFTRQLSQLASAPSKIGAPTGVPCVQDATCFSWHTASVSRPDSRQPLDHDNRRRVSHQINNSAMSRLRYHG